MCLIDHLTYLNLCDKMFPELNSEFVQIEDLNANPADKMNLLLQLLSEELRVDLSKVDGNEIMKFNLEHIQRFIVVLH